MIKIYEEHSEFHEFSKFDTEIGRLTPLTKKEFNKFLPKDYKKTNEYIQKIKTEKTTIFTGEKPETHTRFPRRIYFQITRNCNLACDYCFIKSEKGDPAVPTSSIMNVAEFMGKSGLTEVRLTGGEPTTHPDFLDIMHKFKEEGVYVSLASNGMWNKKTLDALCEEQNLWTICSLDGNKETHNKYRPGTYNKIISNLKQLKKRNPSSRIRLTTVLTKKNKNQMYNLGEIGAMVGAESITVIPLRPQVRNSEITTEMVKGEEFKYVIEDLLKTKEKFGIPFTTTMETDYKDQIYKDPLVRKRSSCAAGREATNLDYDAKNEEFIVYACSYSPASDLNENQKLRKPFLAGTFKDDNVESFLDIWRDEEAWKLFRDLTIRSQNCKSCVYLSNHKCTGSCPIQNIDYSSIDVNQDMISQLKNQIEHTSEWYCYKTLDK